MAHWDTARFGLGLTQQTLNRATRDDDPTIPDRLHSFDEIGKSRFRSLPSGDAIAPDEFLDLRADAA